MTNNKTPQDNPSSKIKTLKNIENICLSTSLISGGGFLTGAMFENVPLALISGGIGVASILGAYYSSNKQNSLEQDTTEQNPTQNNQYNPPDTNTNSNTSTNPIPNINPNLKSSDYARNLENYTKVVKKIFNKDQYKPINKK